MALSTGLFASPPVTSIRRRLVPLRFSGAAGLSDCAASAIAHTAGPSASRKASNARREILMSMVFSPTLSPLYSSAINLASDHPIRMIVPSSGESHQQDELSPVNKVEPERGTSPQPQRGSLLCEGFKEETLHGIRHRCDPRRPRARTRDGRHRRADFSDLHLRAGGARQR